MNNLTNTKRLLKFTFSLFLVLMISAFSINTKTDTTVVKYTVTLEEEGLQVCVITHPMVSETEITREVLRQILLGQKIRWSDRAKIKLALMKSNTEIGKYTAENVLNITSSELDRHYLMMVFQGKISAPNTFNGEESLVEFVKNNTGAIGIVSVDNKGTNNVLKINGEQFL